MKTILCYLPSLLFLTFYLCVGFILSFEGINPLVWLLCALLLSGGYLMSKGRWWGAVTGLVTGSFYIYLSFQENGQVIS